MCASPPTEERACALREPAWLRRPDEPHELDEVADLDEVNELDEVDEVMPRSRGHTPHIWCPIVGSGDLGPWPLPLDIHIGHYK